MTVAERRAWYMLAVAILAAIAFAVLIPVVGAVRAQAAMAVLALTGLTDLIGMKERRAGKVIQDERDAAIQLRAGLNALGAVWLAMFAAYSAVMYRHGDADTITIPTGALGFAPMGAWELFLLVFSITVIAKYKAGRAG